MVSKGSDHLRIIIEQAGKIQDHQVAALDVDLGDQLGNPGYEVFPMFPPDQNPALTAVIGGFESRDPAENLSFGRTTFQTDEVVLVVVSLGKFVQAFLREKNIEAAELFRGFPIPDSGEVQQPPPPMVAHVVKGDSILRDFAAAKTQFDTGFQPFREIRQHLGRDRSVNAVDLPKTPDDQPERLPIPF